jgi:hypothetical protein
MLRLQKLVADKMRADPDVTGVVSVVGISPLNATPNAGRLAITLRPRDDRESSVTAVIERLQHAMAAIPGVIVFFQPVQDIQISTRVSRAQYQYTLAGTDSKEVGDWTAKLTQKLQTSDVLQDVASEAQDNGFQMNVQIDRETAGRLGVSVQTIVDTLSDAFGQRQISTIYGQSNQYRVILEAKPEYQNDPTSLSKIYVPASGIQAVAQSTSLTSSSPQVIPGVSGSPMVPLNAIARFETMSDMGEHYMVGMFPYYRTKLPIFFNLEMRDWSAAAALEAIAGAPPETQTLTFWARTVAAGHLHQPRQARDSLVASDALIEKIKRGRHAYFADSTGARITRREMLAWIAFS